MKMVMNIMNKLIMSLICDISYLWQFQDFNREEIIRKEKQLLNLLGGQIKK